VISRLNAPDLSQIEVIGQFSHPSIALSWWRNLLEKPRQGANRAGKKAASRNRFRQRLP